MMPTEQADRIAGLVQELREVGASQQHIDTNFARATLATGTIRKAADLIETLSQQVMALESGLTRSQAQVREAVDAAQPVWSGELTALQARVGEAADYLDALGDNMLRNDADMLLDDCEDPKAVADRLRALLTPPAPHSDGER